MNILIKHDEASLLQEKANGFDVHYLPIDTEEPNSKTDTLGKKRFSITIELDTEEIEKILTLQKCLLINMPTLINGLETVEALQMKDSVTFLTVQEMTNKVFPTENNTDFEETPEFHDFLIKMAQEAELELKTNKKSYNNINDLFNALQD
jgi:hypothetical protein